MKRIIFLLMLICGFLAPMQMYAMNEEKEKDLEMGVVHLDDSEKENSSEEKDLTEDIRTEYCNCGGIMCDKNPHTDDESKDYAWRAMCCKKECCLWNPKNMVKKYGLRCCGCVIFVVAVSIILSLEYS